MKNLIRVLMIFALLGLLSACSVPFLRQPQTSKQTRPEGATQAEPAASSEAKAQPPPASLIEDLKTMLATKLGVASANVFVKESTTVEWNDSCLGAARPGEMCAQVITPGYRIVLGTLTQEFEFHTDRTGKNFRRVEPKAGQAKPVELPEPIVEKKQNPETK